MQSSLPEMRDVQGYPQAKILYLKKTPGNSKLKGSKQSLNHCGFHLSFYHTNTMTHY